MAEIEVNDTTVLLELPVDPADEIKSGYADPEIQEKDGRLVVGYLAQDTDCEDPLLSCDGMGHLYSAHKQAPSSSHSSMRKALGLSREWQPDLEHDGEEISEETWRELRKAGLVGDPYVVVLDCYQHGGTSWSVTGQGSSCQWDNARGAGVWVPDDTLREMLDKLRESDGFDAAKEQAEVYAKEALTVYNEWLAGNCYGAVICVYVKEPTGYTLISHDTCWGLIGLASASAVTKELVAEQVASLEEEAA
jgi:hypothetical protein